MKSSQSLVFGENAGEYLAFRPQYPEALFDWLAGVAKTTRLAWDCGTGSGQAALGLSRRFDRVLATDEDRRQLDLAPKRPNIDYLLAAAEDDPGLRGEVDLISCACAIHWFDLPRFYEAASQALRPDGVIAAWTYDWPWTNSEPLDLVLRKLKEDILGPYWGEISVFYFNRYENLPFPFAELEHPAFDTPIAHSLGDLISFLTTWSAVRKYKRHEGRDPLSLVEKELEAAWNANPLPLPLRAPLHMRCGRKKAGA